jgi:hypothetical protein
MTLFVHHQNILVKVAVVVFAAVGFGCGSYGFTGSTLPPHLETISIPIFEDQTRSAIPNLSDSITELLIDRFVNQTRLRLGAGPSTSDTILSGVVIRYRNQPAAVSSGETATVNRVNITVSARFEDRKKGLDMVPERTFTAFGEYDPVADGIDGENDAAIDALEQIADDVFTAATSNW